MGDIEVSESVKKVAQQVRHYLVTFLGKTNKEASEEEFYRALSWVLREEVMVNWTATQQTVLKKKARRVYYFSLEWLPGRLMANNISNISSWDVVANVIKHLGRDVNAILNVDHEPGLGNGGLGRLAACYLDSLATHHYPSMGYGLRYQYGIFGQELWYGVQVERPDPWLRTEYPWEFRQDAYAQFVHYGGRVVKKQNKHNEDIHLLVDFDNVRAIAYDVPIVGYKGAEDFSVQTLRLFNTRESPGNFKLAEFNTGDLGTAAENIAVSNVLYPNDKNSLGLRMRLKQEYLLVTASLKDIIRQYRMMYDDFKEFGDVIRIQINDTHPALVIAELMRLLTHEHEIKWDEAWEITKTVCSYTNHTVLKESLEAWDISMIQEILPRQYHVIEKINYDFCNQVRSKFPNDEDKVKRMSIIEDGRVHMAHLAIVGSHKVNGVAALHSQILRESIFPEFNEMYPDLFTNVTNGVTPRRWINLCNPQLSKLITKAIGDGWLTDLDQLERLHDFATDSSFQEEMRKIKFDNKKRLLDVLCTEKKERYKDAVDLEKEFFLEDDALFDVQVKRIHEYKRQFMKALYTIMLMLDIDKNPDAHKVKRKVILGGKAAPGYDIAKDIIRLYYMLARRINSDPKIGEKLKVVYVENYNVSKAELIIPATDLSNQISTAGQEASGTGNMKFTMNGAMTIGTDDGANVEMREAVTDKWWPFLFGRSSDEIMQLTKDNSYNPEDVVNRDPEIRAALDLLKDGALAENDVEKDVLMALYNSLMIGQGRDRYFVLEDLRSYYDAQMRVEELYATPDKWTEMAIHNMASMGRFSSDNSVKNYAENIWGVDKCPIDKEELARVKKLFSDSDRCRTA